MTEHDGPVRVSRFEWERLMMMSDLPQQDRFKLLALGIFMDSRGGSARPGNAGLAMFGPHEETWKKLLRRAVKDGWLILVRRGGARRGPGGTTIRRASVYAAAVPLEVWELREKLLGSWPYRAPGVEGSADDSLKEASEAFPADMTELKEAPMASFEDSDRPLEGSVNGLPSQVLKEAPEALEGSPQGLPHHAVPTSRSTTTAAGKPADSGQQQKQQQPSKHQVADDLTAAFWKLHGKGRAQSFIAVRGVVRTAIGNGVDRDDLARALERVVLDGYSISGATLDIALGKIRNARGPYQNSDDQDVYDEELR